MQLVCKHLCLRLCQIGDVLHVGWSAQCASLRPGGRQSCQIERRRRSRDETGFVECLRVALGIAR